MNVPGTRLACTSVAGPDRIAHEVAEDELVAGSADGTYRALCGAVVLPASMTVTAQARCACCAAVRLHPELPDATGHTRAWRRGIGVALRECACFARCASRPQGAVYAA